MKYDRDYLRTLFETHTIEDFLQIVQEEKIEDPFIRAIVSTLRRSVRALNLQFNPVIINSEPEKSQETNQDHQ